MMVMVNVSSNSFLVSNMCNLLHVLIVYLMCSSKFIKTCCNIRYMRYHIILYTGTYTHNGYITSFTF